MKKLHLLGALSVVAGLALVTTQALASVGSGRNSWPGAPGGTHGPPATPTVGPGTPTATPHPGGPPPNVPGPKPNGPTGPHGQPQILRGTIAHLTSTDMTLTLTDGSTVTVGLSPDSKIHVPGPKSQGDTLLVGMHVVVMAFPDQNNNLVARAMLVIPGQPVMVHRVGTVTAYSAGASITIRATDGNTYTFDLTADTKILPQGSQVTMGALVTIIAPRDPSQLVWTAIGIVVHPSQ